MAKARNRRILPHTTGEQRCVKCNKPCRDRGPRFDILGTSCRHGQQHEDGQSRGNDTSQWSLHA